MWPASTMRVYFVLLSYVLLVKVAYVTTAPKDLHCGINEEPSNCAIVCPPQSCEISYTEYTCNVTECQPGCNCIQDYLRNKDGVCIYNEECPPPPTLPHCGDNEIASLCAQQCPPQTCDFSSDEYACKPGPCQPGCDCIDGYLRDSDGKCIPKEQCNARKKCGSKISCSINETYVYCNAGCPTLNCPVNDNRAYIACEPYPCAPGCACLKNYKRIREGGNCILATDCPPVNCTRPNEKWNPCPEPCFLDLCRDLNRPCELNYWNCSPQCTCIEGYLRNDSDRCVPKDECPK